GSSSVAYAPLLDFKCDFTFGYASAGAALLIDPVVWLDFSDSGHVGPSSRVRSLVGGAPEALDQGRWRRIHAEAMRKAYFAMSPGAVAGNIGSRWPETVSLLVITCQASLTSLRLQVLRSQIIPPWGTQMGCENKFNLSQPFNQNGPNTDYNLVTLGSFLSL